MIISSTRTGKPLALLLVAALALAACGGQAPAVGGTQQYEGARLDGPAPDFRLTDHLGRPAALSDFRGKAVLLTFFDSRCNDVCPLTSLHLRQVRRDLGERADSVVFLGVNVNTRASSVRDVAKATKQWGLGEIPTWRFLTGPRAALQPVWKSYAVMVTPPPNDPDDIVHSPGVFVIDQRGNQRWYVSPPPEGQGAGGPEFSELLGKRVGEVLSGG
jgi:protein SCO1/2